MLWVLCKDGFPDEKADAFWILINNPDRNIIRVATPIILRGVDFFLIPATLSRPPMIENRILLLYWLGERKNFLCCWWIVKFSGRRQKRGLVDAKSLEGRMFCFNGTISNRWPDRLCVDPMEMNSDCRFHLTQASVMIFRKCFDYDETTLQDRSDALQWLGPFSDQRERKPVCTSFKNRNTSRWKSADPKFCSIRWHEEFPILPFLSKLHVALPKSRRTMESTAMISAVLLLWRKVLSPILNHNSDWNKRHFFSLSKTIEVLLVGLSHKGPTLASYKGNLPSISLRTTVGLGAIRTSITVKHNNRNDSFSASRSYTFG